MPHPSAQATSVGYVPISAEEEIVDPHAPLVTGASFKSAVIEIPEASPQRGFTRRYGRIILPTTVATSRLEKTQPSFLELLQNNSQLAWRSELLPQMFRSEGEPKPPEGFPKIELGVSSVFDDLVNGIVLFPGETLSLRVSGVAIQKLELYSFFIGRELTQLGSGGFFSTDRTNLGSLSYIQERID
jgi:hypothetical protein